MKINDPVTAEMPDKVYGYAAVHSENDRTLRVAATDSKLIHAHVGPLQISMSAQNWQVLTAAVDAITEPATPARQFRLVVDESVDA